MVSLLSLEKCIQDEFSDCFFVLLDILQEVARRATRSTQQIREVWTLPERSIRISPSAFTTLMLDMLHSAAQDRLSMGDLVTSRMLMAIFSGTAEPIWTMIRNWMRDGMQIQDVGNPLQKGLAREGSLDGEFFIEDNELHLLDPDFWNEGFTLRDTASADESRGNTISEILVEIAPHVLSAGKAVGLLRILGVTALSDLEAKHQWLTSWKTFTTLLQSAQISDGMSTISTHHVSQLIQDELLPHCKLAQEMLRHVLTEECDFWQHLDAVEDFCLMRRGDAMSHFVDVLFTRVGVPSVQSL